MRLTEVDDESHSKKMNNREINIFFFVKKIFFQKGKMKIRKISFSRLLSRIWWTFFIQNTISWPKREYKKVHVSPFFTNFSFKKSNFDKNSPKP